MQFLIGKKITSIIYFNNEFKIIIENNYLLQYSNNQIQFGECEDKLKEDNTGPICTKNFNHENIAFTKVKELIIGKVISSAADFQTYFELGVASELNLGLLPPNGIHLMIFDEISNEDK